jgi:NADH:ubiquinone oxidoreductase subunit 5 (subunit L)/multisubunit Na+/H+ antiporter MnhA subunit
MNNSPNRSTLRAWFAFGLRLLGFWEILSAASYFLTGLNISMGYTKPLAGQSSFGSYMTQAIGHLVLALWLITWATKIAAFVYAEPSPREDDSAAKPPDSDTPTI